MDISLNNFAKSETISKGEVLFKEDEVANAFYIIESGSIRCIKKNQNRISPIATFTSGEIIAEECVFSSQGVYFYSAIALENTVIVKIEKSDVQAYLGEQSPWINNILDNMSEKVQNTISLIAEHRIEDDKLLKGRPFTEEEEVSLKSKL